MRQRPQDRGQRLHHRKQGLGSGGIVAYHLTQKLRQFLLAFGEHMMRNRD